MQIFPLIDTILDKVERWERRKLYGHEQSYSSQTDLRYKPNSITYYLHGIFILVFLGGPLLAIAVGIMYLPISLTMQWLLLMAYSLTLLVGGVMALVKLTRK